MRSMLSHIRRAGDAVIARGLGLCPDPLRRIGVGHVLSRRFAAVMGSRPHRDPPQSFNERILHRIIHDRDPRLRIICDKLALRGFIAETLGPSFVVPLIASWSGAEEFDFAALPSSFVLKPNQWSGHCILVRQKDEADVRHLAEQAAGWLRRDYFHVSLEWGHLGLPRHVLVEPLLTGPDGGRVLEVQVQVVRGRAIHVGVITGDRGTPERYGDWFYPDGTRHPGRRRAPLRHGPLPAVVLEQAVPVAERIGGLFEQMRVDVYVTPDGVKIGELSPYHAAGRAKFDPPELDLELGRRWAGLLQQR